MKRDIRAIRTLAVDSQSGALEVGFDDGSVATVTPPGGGQVEWADSFSWVSIDAAAGILKMTLITGQPVIAELFRPEVDLAVRRGGRKVIYLDQNKWIALAQAVHSPTRLSEADRTAALALIALIRSGRVIVPLSSGHLVETGRTYGRWRTQTAPLMVELSRGWILRDPLQVRHGELLRSFCRQLDVTFQPAPVITLDPEAFFAPPPRAGRTPLAPPMRLPRVRGIEELAGLLEAVRGAMSVYSTLLEDVADDSVEGLNAAAAWAQVNASLSNASTSYRGSRDQLRQYTLNVLLRDLEHDIALAAAEARLRPDDLKLWFHEADAELADAPFLGLYRELMHQRLRNPQEKWTDHDLIDVSFLTCAAGYADVVVAERMTAAYLRNAQKIRGGSGALICTGIGEAMKAVAA